MGCDDASDGSGRPGDEGGPPPEPISPGTASVVVVDPGALVLVTVDGVGTGMVGVGKPGSLRNVEVGLATEVVVTEPGTVVGGGIVSPVVEDVVEATVVVGADSTVKFA